MMKFLRTLVTVAEISTSSSLMIFIRLGTTLIIVLIPFAEPVHSRYKLVLDLLRTFLTACQSQSSPTDIGYSLIPSPPLYSYSTRI